MPTDEFTVKLTNVRLSFPHLFEPSASVKDGPLKYRANFLIDPATPDGKASIAAMQKAIKHAEMDKWKKSPQVYKGDRCCLQDGNTKMNNASGDIYDGYEGMMVVNASTDNRPVVVNRSRVPVSKEDNLFYAGCYVNAVVRLYTVDGADKGGKGLFAGLQAVQFSGPGEAFGAGQVNPDEVFDDLEDDASDGASLLD